MIPKMWNTPPPKPQDNSINMDYFIPYRFAPSNKTRFLIETGFIAFGILKV